MTQRSRARPTRPRAKRERRCCPGCQGYFEVRAHSPAQYCSKQCASLVAASRRPAKPLPTAGGPLPFAAVLDIRARYRRLIYRLAKAYNVPPDEIVRQFEHL